MASIFWWCRKAAGCGRRDGSALADDQQHALHVAVADSSQVFHSSLGVHHARRGVLWRLGVGNDGDFADGVETSAVHAPRTGAGEFRCMSAHRRLVGDGDLSIEPGRCVTTSRHQQWRGDGRSKMEYHKRLRALRWRALRKIGQVYGGGILGVIGRS